MHGYHEGVSCAEDVKNCPYCGEEIESRYGDGTAECTNCMKRFAVVLLEEQEGWWEE